MSDDIRKLAADVAELARYASELGIDGTAAQLPAEPSRKALRRLPSLPRREGATPSGPAEAFVPGNLTRDPASEENQAERRVSRVGLLESARLSKLDAVVTAEPPRPAAAPAPSPEAQATAGLADASRPLAPSKETMQEIRAEIGDCRRCGLCSDRTQIVHSTGDTGAKLMFVGEAPGADEDLKGEPFVGRAGQLLTKIIEAIGLRRDEVFIGNINRCRPPGNRAPTAAEAEACKPFLLREIAIVKPQVIVVLGNTACQNLLGTKVGITKLRGNFQEFHGIKVMPTFHPAYLLRDPNKKREVWEDMKIVRDHLNSL